MKPVRFQLSRKAGYRLPANAKSVARPHKWGNPYPTKPGKSTRPGDVLHGIELSLMMYRERILRMAAAGVLDLDELQGRNLACWCRLGEPCHADVLLELAHLR